MPLTDFRPLPLLGNPHVQTYLGALVAGRGCPPPGTSHVVRLLDGDALLLHENVSPASLLLHNSLIRLRQENFLLR